MLEILTVCVRGYHCECTLTTSCVESRGVHRIMYVSKLRQYSWSYWGHQHVYNDIGSTVSVYLFVGLCVCVYTDSLWIRTWWGADCALLCSPSVCVQERCYVLWCPVLASKLWRATGFECHMTSDHSTQRFILIGHTWAWLKQTSRHQSSPC